MFLPTSGWRYIPGRWWATQSQNSRSEKRKGEARLKKQQRWDEAKGQSIHQSTLQMTQDHCLCESPLAISHTTSQHQIKLQGWAERTNVVKTSPRSLPSAFNSLPSPLSQLRQMMTQDVDMWTWRAVKTDVVPILLIFCLRWEKKQLLAQLHSWKLCRFGRYAAWK